MGKILISTANTEESRLAVIDHEILTSYLSVIEGHVDRRLGIFSGVVEEVDPAISACFVNIGDSGKKGLLPFAAIAEEYLAPGKGSIDKRIKIGMRLLVQVLTDSHGEKGPKLTSRIRLFGKNLRLMPRERNPKPLMLSVSTNTKQHQHLVEAFEVPDGFTVEIPNFDSLELPIEELVRQKDNLLEFWKHIQQAFDEAKGPCPIYDNSDIVNICLTEYYSSSIDEIVCDDARTLDDIKKSMEIMQLAKPATMRVTEPKESVFSNSILQQIDTLRARKVNLKSGGEIVIDITEALIAIDINSKSAHKQASKEQTALHTNLEAASEICRQLRLRNLAGQIVIDFIGMKSKDDQQKVKQLIKDEFKQDPAHTVVGTISQFGLLELSRQNIGRPLQEAHPIPCAHCDGTGRGFTALDILARIKNTAVNLNSEVKVIYAELPFDIATDLLNKRRQELESYRNNHGIEIIIIPSSSLMGRNYKIFHTEQAVSLDDQQKNQNYNVHIPPYLTTNIRKNIKASVDSRKALEMIHAQYSQADTSSTPSKSNKKKQDGD